MASRKRAVRTSGAGNEVSECPAGDGYHYLPWVDCICAGVPCQDVSVAGKRAGIKGERTGLVYEFARILRELRPTWFVFENVPGLLSSNEGRDFAEVLRLFMVECGYGVSWRVLDSQFFGVAQRRSRLFVVGYFGKPCPAEILFESPSVPRSVTKGGEAETNLAVPLTSGIGVCGKPSGRRMEDDFNLAVCGALDQFAGGPDDNAGQQGHIVTAPIDGTWAKGGSGKSDYPVGIVAAPVGALQSHSKRHGHAMSTQQAAESGQIIAHALSASTGHHGHSSPRGDGSDNLVAAPITASYGKQPDSSDRNGGPPNVLLVSAAPDTYGVRDFTGLPAGMDSPRYRALGNAVTVPVMHWIGKRIIAAEKSPIEPEGHTNG